jgi:hypothetical protein
MWIRISGSAGIAAYMVLSTDTLEEVVKPHLRQKYILEKNDWFPRDDTPEHDAYDKRTPGLFPCTCLCGCRLDVY